MLAVARASTCPRPGTRRARPCPPSTSLALTNRGGATGADIEALARAVRERVFDAFGVTLVPEPVTGRYRLVAGAPCAERVEEATVKEYVEGLEREFSAIERGFLREQRRARSDYASFDPEQARRVAFLAYRSEAYQVRMYAVFLLGHLSQESDVLSFRSGRCFRGFQLESARGPREGLR